MGGGGGPRRACSLAGVVEIVVAADRAAAALAVVIVVGAVVVIASCAHATLRRRGGRNRRSFARASNASRSPSKREKSSPVGGRERRRRRRVEAELRLQHLGVTDATKSAAGRSPGTARSARARRGSVVQVDRKEDGALRHEHEAVLLDDIDDEALRIRPPRDQHALAESNMQHRVLTTAMRSSPPRASSAIAPTDQPKPSTPGSVALSASTAPCAADGRVLAAGIRARRELQRAGAPRRRRHVEEAAAQAQPHVGAARVRVRLLEARAPPQSGTNVDLSNSGSAASSRRPSPRRC